MHMLVAIFVNTPLWVWAILAALVVIGMRRTSAHEVSLLSLILPPAIFIILMIARMIQSHFAVPVLVGTLVGAVLGGMIVAILKPARNTRLQDNGKILIEGEYVSLVLYLLVFAANYISHVLVAINPTLGSSDAVRLAFSVANGLSVSVALVRAILHDRKARADRELLPMGLSR
jgi:hypothetical protein